MKSLYLLVVLTQNAAGDINAAFVNTRTIEQCQYKAAQVTGVFDRAKLPVIEQRCIESLLQFSEFEHSARSAAKRYFYVLEFSDEDVEIASAPDWRACMAHAKQAAGEGRRYCASSVQRIESSP